MLVFEPSRAKKSTNVSCVTTENAEYFQVQGNGLEKVALTLSILLWQSHLDYL
jgi:hypothetical protein